MGKLLGCLGGLLTAAYIAGLAWLTKGRLEALKTMDLNAVGDFMAGAFGPLAILWLVLGYFQQGIELRQNSKALRMQADELRNSVAQQKELATAARESLEFQYESAKRSDQIHKDNLRPKFIQQATTCMAIYHSSPDALKPAAFQLTLDLINLGNRCSQLRIQSKLKDIHCEISKTFVPTDANLSIKCRIPENIATLQPAKLTLHYCDASGSPHSEEIRVISLQDTESPYVLALDSYLNQHKKQTE